MNFIYKCYLQKFFSVIPGGEKLNFLFQKYVTKTYPLSDKVFIMVLNWAKKNFDIFTKYSQSPPEDTTYYEFGAGDLIHPIAMSLLGMHTLYCLDIHQLVFPELLNDTISKLRRLRDKAPFDYSLPEEIPQLTTANFRNILLKYFRIDYRAPLDAKDTDFQDGSVDFIACNATLEHIPEDDIGKILAECHRILKDGGVMSMLIDYCDHWQYFDKDLSRYNFLRYSPSEWRRYNPSLQYQNRLRHKDYLDIISQIDFEIVETKLYLPSEEELGSFRSLPVDAFFLDNYTCEELTVISAWIALRK